MIDPKELGRKGEQIAADELQKKGYSIVCQNYQFNKAEIDIVASHNDLIVFVEVKTRVSSYLTEPSLLVTMKKQRQIIKAADQYIKDFFPAKEWRFDIMVVVTNQEYTTVEHITDAFYPMV